MPAETAPPKPEDQTEDPQEPLPYADGETTDGDPNAAPEPQAGENSGGEAEGSEDGDGTSETSSGEKDSDTSEPQGEATAEQAQDAENRYTDAEILGKSFRVRRIVQEAGTQSIKTWQGLKAKIHNAFDTPGKAVKEFAHNRAQASHQRKEAKLDARKNEQNDKQHAVSSEKFQPKVDKAQEKVNSAKEKMDRRKDSLDEHVGRMEGRTRAVHENAESRRNNYNAELIDKKSHAEARKAVRHELRKENSRRDTREIMANISPDQMGQIGKVAVVSETSRRQYTEAKAAEFGAKRQHRRTEERMANAGERADRAADNVQTSDETATRIFNTELPAAQQKYNDLKAELDKTDPSSEDHSRLSFELNQAEKTYQSLDRQLRHSERSSESNQRRNARANEQAFDMYNALPGQKEAIASAAQEAVKRGTIDEKHRAELEQIINQTLNPNAANEAQPQQSSKKG
jgi:hypothetical protein